MNTNFSTPTNNTELNRILSARTPSEKLAAIIRTFTRSTAPEKDAETLLSNFCSLKNVFEAQAETLESYVGRSTAGKLAAILPVFRMYQGELAKEPQTICNRNELEWFCKSLLQGEQIEKFYVIAVNSRAQVVGVKLISVGSISEVSAYPRTIVKFAMDVNAHSVFFTHNHPGGTCAPSAEDIATTAQMQRILSALNVHILDHMIIAGDSGYSFAQHGEINL